MTIRILTPDDVDAYRALRLLSLVESPTASWATLDEEEAVPLATMGQRLQAGETQTVFGAFDGERLVGLAGLKREAGAKVRHRANIWGIYIDPAARRMGLARALVVAIIAYARTVPALVQLTLVVNSANPAAIALYASLGFIVTGVERRSTFIDGVYHDETRMLLLLDA